MAQKLKENMRNSIIEAAKKELLTFGYKDASMRNIAKMSNMTVGNLYRYFESKDDLIQNIVTPTLKEIEDSIYKDCDIYINFGNQNTIIDLDKLEMVSVFDRISDDLVDIYFRNRDEMQILMMHSTLNKELSLWFSSLITHIISEEVKEALSDGEIAILARAYANSIFNGVTECLKDVNLSKDRLKYVLKLYFRSFTSGIHLNKGTILGV